MKISKLIKLMSQTLRVRSINGEEYNMEADRNCHVYEHDNHTFEGHLAFVEFEKDGSYSWEMIREEPDIQTIEEGFDLLFKSSEVLDVLFAFSIGCNITDCKIIEDQEFSLIAAQEEDGF